MSGERIEGVGPEGVAAAEAAPAKAMVLCSGGVDSTTLLAMACNKYGSENVHALSISYGQSIIARLKAPRR